jgi:hypothetical protein
VTGGSSGRLWCWLIERLASTPDRDAMIGDLLEQSRRDHSAVSWARQASAIIFVSLAREIVGHRWLVASALLVGCATAAVTGNAARLSPDVTTVVAVWVVFRVYRQIRVSALLALLVFVSSMHLATVSVVVISVLEHFGGLEFLIRQGLRQLSLPVLLGAVLLALVIRQRPVKPSVSLAAV